MTTADFQSVKELFDRCLDLSPEAREKVLAAADVSDSIRAEAARLLANLGRAGDDWLEPPVTVRQILEHQQASPPALAAGANVGSCRILAPLGTGGMGEVYRARDTRLDREVALKVLPPAFARDPERLARFDREAKVLASLNHPHIAQIYGVEESEGIRGLVMELVPGKPVRGPLPLAEALAYAIQIADALDAAHRNRVVHRDLKPANILLTRSGIKLLDFGLASRGPAIRADDAAAASLTGRHEILGTLRYMSPEQLQGGAVDARSDIFSFGLVLYEMLTGRHAFDGASNASVMAAILERPAPSLPVSGGDDVAPPALNHLLQRCLEKDPDDRWPTARMLKSELEWIASSVAAADEAPGAPGKKSRRRAPVAVAAFAAGTLAAVAGLLFWAPWRAAENPADHPLMRLDVDLGPDVSLAVLSLSGGSTIAISPDGTQLAYVSGNPPRLFLRRLDQTVPTELVGARGAARVFFSPDGKWIGFLVGNSLQKIAVEGGGAVPIGDVSDFAGATWSPDGNIYASEPRRRGIVRFPADGGEPEIVAPLRDGERALGNPRILPGGKALLFASNQGGGVFRSTIEALTLADGHRKVVVRGGGNSPRYVASSGRTGHLLYLNKATLYAVPFDPDKLETIGKPVPIVNDIAHTSLGASNFDFSRTGSLVYRKASGEDSAAVTLRWIDPRGRQEPIRAMPGAYWYLRLSPDGTRVALTVTEGAKRDIEVYDLVHDVMTPVTFGAAIYNHAAWSPDGKYLVFESEGHGLSIAPADGTGQPRLLTETQISQVPGDFSPDGKRLAYEDRRSGTPQIWTMPLENQGGRWKAGAPEPFSSNHFFEQNPRFSPDGRWIVYQSDESGNNEIYVRPFPLSPAGQARRWQVSAGGGVEPHWAKNGHDLLYRSIDQIMIAGYTVKNDVFVAERPRVWIDKLAGRPWDIPPDSTRAAQLTPVKPEEGPRHEHTVTLLLNVFDEMRRRAPADK